MTKSQVEFEFDIQNAENIHDKGTLNTWWNKVRDAQRTKTILGRNMGGYVMDHNTTRKRETIRHNKSESY